MAATFKVDGLDLSTHLKVNQGDGLDPYTQGFLNPQFAEGALSDGDPLISVQEGNREQSWTVILNPAKAGYANTKDGLHQFVRDVNRALKTAVQVEWRDDGATRSTYLDPQFARFEPAWDYRRSQKLWVPGVIRVWTRPYGHTATARVVATALATRAAGMLSIASGALDGDADAELKTTISLPSGANTKRVFAGVSVGPASGWLAITPAASIGNAATLISASGAFASQAARSQPITNTLPQALNISLSASAHPDGVQRLIALVRTTVATSAASALALRAYRSFGAAGSVALGPTQTIQSGRDWRVVDLGAFTAGTSVLLFETITIYGGLLSSGAATSTFDLGGLLVLPEAKTVFAGQPSVNVIGWAAATLIVDGITRTTLDTSGHPTQMLTQLSLEDQVRGEYPRAPVASGCNVVAFAVQDDGPQNGPVSVEIRVREKFTYAR